LQKNDDRKNTNKKEILELKIVHIKDIFEEASELKKKNLKKLLKKDIKSVKNTLNDKNNANLKDLN